MHRDSDRNLRQPVRVVALEQGKAWVESVRKQDCPKCAAGEGCGGGIFTRLFGNKCYRLCVPVDRSFEVDDLVYLEVPERNVTVAAATVYLLPLLLAFLGSMLGHLGDAKGSEAGAIAGAVLGFLAGIVMAKRVARQWSRRWEWRLVEAGEQDEVVCRWPKQN